MTGAYRTKAMRPEYPEPAHPLESGDLILAAMIGPAPSPRVPYEHHPLDVALGRLPYTCKPPGFWSRFWNNVPVGAIWTCNCGGRWEFVGWPENWRKK